MTAKHTGACFCGAVTLEVAGAPELMGYCHCSSCRSWSASPVTAFTLWKPESFKVMNGAQFIGRFQKGKNSDRRWCTKCGGHLFTQHPLWGITDVYAATIPTLAFVPALHVNYVETVLPMRDGLPKLKDFPTDVGGSGVTVPE